MHRTDVVPRAHATGPHGGVPARGLLECSAAEREGARLYLRASRTLVAKPRQRECSGRCAARGDAARIARACVIAAQVWITLPVTRLVHCFEGRSDLRLPQNTARAATARQRARAYAMTTRLQTRARVVHRGTDQRRCCYRRSISQPARGAALGCGPFASIRSTRLESVC